MSRPTTSAAVPRTLPRRMVSGYAIGSVGTGGFGTLPGLVLGYYLTDTLGVAAAVAGLAVTLPKIWDVLVDPLIGRASDRSASARGTRRRLMLLGAITLPLCFAAVFAAPAGITGAAAAIWVIVAMLLAATAFSFFQVPYIALPAELADSSAVRTRLIAPRIAVLAVAILAFGAGGPALRDAAGGDRTGYLVMGIVAGLVIGGGMLCSTMLTTRRSSAALPRSPDTNSAQHGGFSAGWTAVRECAALRLLLAAFVLQALATGAMLAAAQYVATYTLGNEGAVSVLFAALVAPALLVMPFARRLADKVGKRRALVLSTLLFAAAALALLPARSAPGPWVYGAVAVAGIAYAGMQLYPLALLPDIIEADAHRRGTDRAGAIAGVWTAGETAGLALGPTLALGVLAVTSFRSRTGGQVVDQPGSALWGVVVIFSALPALLALISLIPLRRLAAFA